MGVAGRRVKWVRSKLLVSCFDSSKCFPLSPGDMIPGHSDSTVAGLLLLPILSFVPKGQVTSWTIGKNLKLPESLVSYL